MTNKILTADDFISTIMSMQSEQDLKSMLRFYKTGKGQYAADDQFIGVMMSKVRLIAKNYDHLPASELSIMLQSPYHEVRAGAMYVMEKNTKSNKTSEERRKELFDLYLSHHQHINNWDLVDIACMHVIGGYIFDKPRDILYDLSQSSNLWERRTAIVSTLHFIRQGDLTDAFRLSAILEKDTEDLIHKACGWMLRCCGDKNKAALIDYLEDHAPVMPRTTLRYAIEKFPKSERDYFMGMKK